MLIEVAAMPLEEDPMGRRIDINGASLYVDDQGTGDPIVLVQPGFASSAVYTSLSTLLAANHRVIAFDTRGHGHSTNPAGTLSYGMIADDAAALCDALELDRPIVGGWSDGGQVALEFERRHPGRAGGLLVGAASLDITSQAARDQMRIMFAADERGAIDFAAFSAGWGATIIPWMRPFHPNGEEHWQSVLQQSADMWLSYEGIPDEELARFSVPSLVAVGDRDAFFSLDMILGLFRKLPNAELAVVPGADHMSLLDDAEVLATVIADFTRRH